MVEGVRNRKEAGSFGGAGIYMTIQGRGLCGCDGCGDFVWAFGDEMMYIYI
jgi:hypothetical protein